MFITLQIIPQTSNYHLYPLNMWLIEVTSGNQGQVIMDFKVLKLLSNKNS